MRTASKIPKQGSKGGTFGVAETDLGTPTKTFEGGSPVTGSSPDPTYQPKSTFPSVQGHAEQNLVGSLGKAILAAGLDEAAMEGKSVWMLIEQEVCGPCKSGLGNPSAPSGVLKQFSLEHPKITVEVMNLETGEVLRFRNGALVRE